MNKKEMEYERADLLNEARRVIQEEIDSLQLVRDKIDDGIAESALLIAGADRVIVSGVGKSGIIARKIASTFSSVGVPSVFLHAVDALHGDIGIVQKNDVVILLSKSGSTEEIVNLLPFLKSRCAKLIAIVGNTNSFLARSADIVINGYVEREACPLNIAPMSSAVAALALGDALAACAMRIKNVTIEDFSRQHPLGQIGRNITLQVKDIMHGNSSLPVIGTGATFRDAVIEISNKALGCVCVVDEDMNLAGIITDGDVRRTLQNHEDIRGLMASEIMTKSPVRIKADMYLGEALSVMENRQSQINVLPVVEGENKCVGVIRLHDIVRSGI